VARPVPLRDHKYPAAYPSTASPTPSSLTVPIAGKLNAEKSDLFDVLAHIAYALPPLTREERAARAKLAITTHFNSRQQAFLDFVLSHYVSEGVHELDREKLTPLLKLKYRDAIADAIADLGRPEEIGYLFAGFQKYLYQPLP
jgi:type I restriction enzyme R subunit